MLRHPDPAAMWARCERVSRRGLMEKSWRRGFVVGTLLTHIGWSIAMMFRSLLQ